MGTLLLHRVEYLGSPFSWYWKLFLLILCGHKLLSIKFLFVRDFGIYFIAAVAVLHRHFSILLLLAIEILIFVVPMLLSCQKFRKKLYPGKYFKYGVPLTNELLHLAMNPKKWKFQKSNKSSGIRRKAIIFKTFLLNIVLARRELQPKRHLFSLSRKINCNKLT